jgi:subtilisin family serine protease
MIRTIVRGVVVAAVLAVPGTAMAQSYVPAPDTPIVIKAQPLVESPKAVDAVKDVAPAAAPQAVDAASNLPTSPVVVKGVQLDADTPAFTGSNPKPLVGTSLALLGAGAVVVVMTRRRRTTKG